MSTIKEVWLYSWEYTVGKEGKVRSGSGGVIWILCIYLNYYSCKYSRTIGGQPLISFYLENRYLGKGNSYFRQ